MSDQPNLPGVDEQKALNQEVAAPVSQAETEANQTATELHQTKNQGQTMRLKVYSPYKDYFDGPASSLSAENLTGPFDILPKHHNFISLLSPCELVIRMIENGQQLATRILISGGLIHVKADEVVIFLDV